MFSSICSIFTGTKFCLLLAVFYEATFCTCKFWSGASGDHFRSRFRGRYRSLARLALGMAWPSLASGGFLAQPPGGVVLGADLCWLLLPSPGIVEPGVLDDQSLMPSCCKTTLSKMLLLFCAWSAHALNECCRVSSISRSVDMFVWGCRSGTRLIDLPAVLSECSAGTCQDDHSSPSKYRW